MRLSTKGRYGTRLLLRLALAGPGATCTLREIAHEEAISEKYLWQIARSLRDAGYIRAVPGAKGGYRLAQEPGDITLAGVLAALEGDLALVECGPRPGVCPRAADCAVRTVWAEVTDRLRAILDGVRLSDLVERHRSLRGRPETDYAI